VLAFNLISHLESFIFPVVLDNLGKLDYLLLCFDGLANWPDIKRLLEAAVPRLKAFYLEVAMCSTEEGFGLESHGVVDEILRNLGPGYKREVWLTPGSLYCVKVVVKFAILPAYDRMGEYFLEDNPFYQV
jgi:hypothetical protein